MVNDASAFFGISSPEQFVNSIPKQSFRWSKDRRPNGAIENAGVENAIRS